MIILGIETSCDETAAAVVEFKNNKIEVLASEIASSLEIHAQTGGIIPETAAREQVRSIIPVVEHCIKIAKLKIENLDAIAVTYGPGLIGSLLVGVETAKTLAMVWNKPIVPVNHLHGHLYSCFIDKPPEFPAVGLVVSGGHTDFVLVKNFNDITYIGGTRDDAAGEAFDKCARIIGLGYPGGPAIAEAAASFLRRQESTQLNLFPRPMINSGNLDMSFSGLKTSVLNYTKQNPDFDKNHLAAEIQEAIIDTIVEKSRLAIENYNPKVFLLSGGVSANRTLLDGLQDIVHNCAKGAQLYVPRVKTATDNAIMIATAGLLNYRPISLEKVHANPSLAIDE